MPSTFIHLVRHGQGEHNLPGNWAAKDPSLTPLGRSECAALRERFPHHARITHLVASPMRRTIQTCLIGFYPTVEIVVDVEGENEAGKEGLPPKAKVTATRITAIAPGTDGRIICHPDLQEAWDYPCDTGSPAATLMGEFCADPDPSTHVLDTSRVGPEFLIKSAGSRYDPTFPKLEARSRDVRVFLRELGQKWCAEHSEDAHIVVVMHGSYVNWLTDIWSGFEPGRFSSWKTAEFRTYVFSDSTGSDPNAWLTETDESWVSRKGDEPRLTAEQELKYKNAEFPRWEKELSIRLVGE